MYDPRVGRFLSQDPSGIEASADYNLYRYAGNNPVNATDPTGLMTRMLGGALGGAVGALTGGLGLGVSLAATSYQQNWGSQLYAGLFGALNTASSWAEGLASTGFSFGAQSAQTMMNPVSMIRATTNLVATAALGLAAYAAGDDGTSRTHQHMAGAWSRYLGPDTVGRARRQQGVAAAADAASTAYGGLKAASGVAFGEAWWQGHQATFAALQDPLRVPQRVWEGAQQTATEALTFGMNPPAYVSNLTPEQQGQFWTGVAYAGTGVAMAYGYGRAGNVPDSPENVARTQNPPGKPIATGLHATAPAAPTYKSFNEFVIKNRGQFSDKAEAAIAWNSLANAARSGFILGRHGDFPSPRPIATQSHHGAMSAWMKRHFPGYDPNKAPAILMPESSHERTFGVYNSWRAEMRPLMGGRFEWAKVSESQMRDLSNSMFDAAGVPQQLRTQYWVEFARMKTALSK